MNKPHAIPDADLKLLRQFDTPTVCNVVELFDLRSRAAGYMDKRIRACYPKLPPMVGYATTATFRSASPPASASTCANNTPSASNIAPSPMNVHPPDRSGASIADLGRGK